MESTANDSDGQELDLQQVRERAQQVGFEFDYDWDALKLQHEMDAWLAARTAAQELEAQPGEVAADSPETPDPDGAVDKAEDGGTLVNVGSTTAPVYQRQE